MSTYIQAAPLIGTSTLLYGESVASDVLLTKLEESKVNQPENKLVIRRFVLNEIVKQMPGFQVLLNSILTESETFSTYDANPIIQNWRTTNPKLLKTFYNTTSIQILTESPAKQESLVVVGDKGISRRFVLLGWVDNIHEQEQHTPISGTDKEAHIYNLDIRCEYRLINPDNNHVVAIFVAAGHGGIARVLGSGHAPVSYDARLIVNDMFYSLAEDLRHILRVREDEYVKKQQHAAKLELSKPAAK